MRSCWRVSPDPQGSGPEALPLCPPPGLRHSAGGHLPVPHRDPTTSAVILQSRVPERFPSAPCPWAGGDRKHVRTQRAVLPPS